MTSLAKRWERLSDRDQRIVRIGGALVALMLLWAWLWDPLAGAREQLRLQATANAAALEWMRPAAAKLVAQGGVAVAAGDNRSLLARLDGDARAAGLGSQLVLVEPISNERVRMQFASADFDALVGWLEKQGAAGVQVEELQVQRAAGSGRVDARIALRGPGG